MANEHRADRPHSKFSLAGSEREPWDQRPVEVQGRERETVEVSVYESHFLEVERASAELETIARVETLKHTLREMKFLPTQAKYLAAISSAKYHVVLFTAGNKLGKTWVLAYDLISEALGYQPHDGRPRPRTGYDIALLIRDYDSCGMKIYREGFLQMLPPDCVRVVARTQSGTPRIIQPIDPLTGIQGKHIHLFTHDQDPSRLESGSWQRVGVDEPCPRRHWDGLMRGLQTTGGMCTMTMTLLEGSAWIWEDIHNKSSNQGGPNDRFLALTADPDENRISKGGFIPDQAIDDFRATIPRELWDARVLGKAMHLAGRIFKGFDERVHVIARPLHSEQEIATFPKVLSIDPHPRLPFAMIWCYVAPGDVLVVYDEWPSEPLESLQHVNFTFADYAEIINEHDLPTYAVMDPNYGAQKSLTTGLTVAQEMSTLTGLGFQTEIDDSLTVGHNVVADRLYWDESKPLSNENQPHLLIVARCRNMVRSMNSYIWQEFRGKLADGKSLNPKPQERYKHSADALRYVCMYPGIRYSKMVVNRLHTFGKQVRPAFGGRSLYSRIMSRRRPA